MVNECVLECVLGPPKTFLDGGRRLLHGPCPSCQLKSMMTNSRLWLQIDKDGANPERVKQELSEAGLLPEEWGGKTPMIPVCTCHPHFTSAHGLDTSVSLRSTKHAHLACDGDTMTVSLGQH